MKNFITNLDYSKDALQKMLDQGIAYKNGLGLGTFQGKVLTTIFYNPSLRTLLSFQTGIQKMGGIANVLDMANSRELECDPSAVMDGSASEHIKEFIEVVCAYSDLIAIRKSDFIPNKSNDTSAESFVMSREEMLSDGFLKIVLKYATKPVINMESNMYHPCQSLADMMTMQEISGGQVEKKKYVLTWAPHPKPLPLATPHSQLITPAIFGMDVILACPSEFKLGQEMLETLKSRAEAAGGSFTVTDDQEAALIDADFVCAKSWLSLEYFGQWEMEKQTRDGYTDWIITMEKMRKTKNGKFLHCLPVRRNVVVEDKVLDSEYSVVIQEAENRMWAQMGMMNYLLTN